MKRSLPGMRKQRGALTRCRLKSMTRIPAANPSSITFRSRKNARTPPRNTMSASGTAWWNSWRSTARMTSASPWRTERKSWLKKTPNSWYFSGSEFSYLTAQLQYSSYVPIDTYAFILNLARTECLSIIDAGIDRLFIRQCHLPERVLHYDRGI